jgi:hypothetical protein
MEVINHLMEQMELIYEKKWNLMAIENNSYTRNHLNKFFEP